MAGGGVAPKMHRVKSFMFERRRLGARVGQIMLTPCVESGAGEARAPLVDEEKIAVRELGIPTLGFQIGVQKGQSGIPQGDGPRLVAFALEEHPSLIEIQVGHAQSAEFRSPSPGVVKRAENAEVTVTVPTLSLHTGEDGVDFVFVQAVERPARRAFEGDQKNL